MTYRIDGMLQTGVCKSIVNNGLTLILHMV